MGELADPDDTNEECYTQSLQMGRCAKILGVILYGYALAPRGCQRASHSAVDGLSNLATYASLWASM